MERFKKGQIVPKRLKLALASQAKAQHSIVFGADVEVIGRTIRMLSEGSAIFIPRYCGRPRKNGTRQKCGLYISGINFIPFAIEEDE